MALGDGIRRNVASVDPTERALLRDALIALNKRFFLGDRTDSIPGGVSWWFKQDEIHQATHVHDGPEFLPWHREIVNRLEEMLRSINPQLSLHYWDWTQDPRAVPGANLGGGTTGNLNLFKDDFMGYGGSIPAPIGEPWLAALYYVPGAVNFRSTDPFDPVNKNPADPPREVIRSVSGSPFTDADDQAVLSKSDYAAMRSKVDGLERLHDLAHGFVNMGGRHISFRDPFVFLLHSNVDRLFALWQSDPAHPDRLDANAVYGSERGDVGLNSNIMPWSGVPPTTRPWAPPENEQNQQIAKNYKDPSVVTPRRYDTDPRVVGGGEPRIWLLNGRQVVEDIALIPPAPGWQVVGVGDFNGDGKADLLWRRSDDTGEARIWLLDGRQVVEEIALTPPAPGWRVVGIGDFNGDGKADLLWRRKDETGEARIWLLDGRQVVEDIALTPPAPGWRVIGVGDFNGDGKADLLWRRSNDTGEARIWLLDGRQVVEDIGLKQGAPGWRVIGVGDFNGDGKADLLWRRKDDTGEARLWLLDGTQVVEDIGLKQPAPGWRITGVGDFNGDSKADLLWQLGTPNVLRNMAVSVTPTSIPLNQSVSFAIATTDAQTGTAVAGRVSVDGRDIGDTNTTLTYTFRTKRTRVGGQWEITYPVGIASAAGYVSIGIDFGWPDL